MIQLLGQMGGCIVLCIQPNLSSNFIGSVSGKTVSWGLKLLCYPLCLQGSDTEEIMRPGKVQLAVYNHVHNKRMADRDWPMSTVNPQQYTSDLALWHWQSGTI